MQYLLTQEERDSLVGKEEVVLRDHALAAAREKLLQLADFDCIHKPGGRNIDGYCSDCPCSPIADGNDYKTWIRVCWLQQSYSQ